MHVLMIGTDTTLLTGSIDNTLARMRTTPPALMGRSA